MRLAKREARDAPTTVRASQASNDGPAPGSVADPGIDKPFTGLFRSIPLDAFDGQGPSKPSA
jgi:hypothetical protein